MNHVLVVDDEPNIRKLIRMVLESEGYPVRTATNGVEALQEIDRDPPFVMLLDRQMPVLDGSEVARRLREQGRSVPTVGMTAAPQATRWCAEIAADGCLGKPFDVPDLLAVVAQFRTAATH